MMEQLQWRKKGAWNFSLESFKSEKAYDIFKGFPL